MIPNTKAQNERISLWLTLTVFLVAAMARIPWLSRIGLRGDEDISTLAARGILETGLPAFPSGHLYWRAPLYHYSVAPLVAFGVDWLPRLLSVATSCATAVLLVLVGRRWVGDRAAIAGGFLFALSLIEINIARQIRMYALYQLLSLIALAAIYRLWTTGRMRGLLASAAAVLLAMGSHAIGSTLALMLVFVAVRHRNALLRAAAITAVPAFILLSKAQQLWLRRSASGGLPTLERLGIESPVEAPYKTTATIEASISGFGAGALGPWLFSALVGRASAARAGVALALCRRQPARSPSSIVSAVSDGEASRARSRT